MIDQLSGIFPGHSPTVRGTKQVKDLCLSNEATILLHDSEASPQVYERKKLSAVVSRDCQ
jgi:hypothetical protein